MRGPRAPCTWRVGSPRFWRCLGWHQNSAQHFLSASFFTMASQPDGGYPRLNGSMMNSGQQYTNMIVSLVGRFNSPPSGESIQFECCDQVSVTVSLEQGELPQDMASQPEMFYELIGQVDESNKFMVRLYILKCACLYVLLFDWRHNAGSRITTSVDDIPHHFFVVPCSPQSFLSQENYLQIWIWRCITK